ncbi:patatin-like phospholipase family protein [Ideonella sp. B508-1]|uniref:patatin-like phospholipase family protein n=1 Tax=Ideonella sp. B508-1 TaxID=137716 RepID=UPI000344BF4E|nr:patatin-like phospholipase family protein [Ideonella sp. B508-1]
MSALSSLPVNLALQGGGAHGAFTWGVLDALLEDGRIRPVAISGTSAGAMNAVALAQGLFDDGAEGARASLRRFWKAVADSVPALVGMLPMQNLGTGAVPCMNLALDRTRHLGPANFNPLDINPLREVVQAQFNFERLRREAPVKLFVAATEADTGRTRLFTEDELSCEVLLASACLPTLFHPVPIDGVAYWDGGYSANPAVLPLVAEGRARDTLLVLLNPLHYAQTPQTGADIQARLSAMSVQAGFLREMQLLAQAQQRARRRWWPADRLDRLLARSRFHLLDGGALLGELSVESKMMVQHDFLLTLFEQGRALATQWLARHGTQLGQAATVDLSRVFTSCGAVSPLPALPAPDLLSPRSP